MALRPVRQAPAPVAPSADDSVALGVRREGRATVDVVRLPRSLFGVSNAGPTLDGPRIRVNAAGVSAINARAADASRALIASRADVGQATSFYAATQVVMLTERILGRSIELPRLTMKPRADIVRDPGQVNAVAVGDGTIELGAFGSVRNGRLAGMIPEVRGRAPATRERAPIDLAEDRDIVAHETAHIVLGSLNPALQQNLAGFAFGEAFADLLAFFTSCDDAVAVRDARAENGGDWRMSSPLSRIGEIGGRIDGTGALRDLAATTPVAKVAARAYLTDDWLNGEVPATSATQYYPTSALFSEPVFQAFAEHVNASPERLSQHRDAAAEILFDAARDANAEGLSVSGMAQGMLEAAAAYDARNPGAHWESSLRAAFTARGVI